MADWQPIETAPVQGYVLVWIHLPKNPPASGPAIAVREAFHGEPTDDELGPYREGCWWANGRYYAPGDERGYMTHWMPLPAPPGG